MMHARSTHEAETIAERYAHLGFVAFLEEGQGTVVVTNHPAEHADDPRWRDLWHDVHVDAA